MALSEPAPAKLNLYLHITGRRDDGYHLLDSLVAFVDVGERVRATAEDGLSLRHDGPGGAALAAGLAGADDLVLRAARALARAAGVRRGAALVLDKHMPIAAGLGGGSADAAATLRLLMRLWDVHLPDAALGRIALELGADVPACLAGVPTFMAGIGEVLTPAPELPESHAVIANPGTPLASAEVYGAYDRRAPSGGPPPPPRFATPPSDAFTLGVILSARRNDLEAAAITLAPEIVAVRDLLARLPECLLARMSGSGPSCFALFADALSARRGADFVRRLRPTWWVAHGPLRTASREDDGGARRRG